MLMKWAKIWNLQGILMQNVFQNVFLCAHHLLLTNISPKNLKKVLGKLSQFM